MRHKVIEALLERSLNGPYAIRQILKGGHPNNRKRFRQRQQPKYIKGIYNGHYFRVKLPQTQVGFPSLPSFPSILPVPSSVLFSQSSSKISLETLFPLTGSEESLIRRFLKWCTINWPTLLLNVGSVFTLLAFTRSDVLELRSLSAMGSISNAIYRFTQKPILWVTIVWPSIFASVNGVKIVEILHERNAEVHMDEEQERIYVEYFLQHGVTPKQFQRMEQSAQVLKFEKGEALIRKGDALDQMYLVVDGATQAHIKGRHLTAQSTSANAKVNRLGGDSGAWVGEMAFLDRLGEKERQKAAPSKVERKKNSGDGKEETGKMTKDPKTEEIVQTSSAVAKQIDAPPGPAASKTAFVLYTVLAKEDCKVWKWSFEDMESLMSSSTDLRGALTRAMTSSIVGKVVNMTLSRTSAMPTWSTWLDDWVRDDGAKVQVRRIQTLPEDREGSGENNDREAEKGIEHLLQ